MKMDERMKERNVFPVGKPTFGIYILPSLQLHVSQFRHLIHCLKIEKVFFDCFICAIFTYRLNTAIGNNHLGK